MKERSWQHLTHGFGPLYNADSEVLILGSFPSVKSREQAFFYGHPQNRFWKVIVSVYDEAPADDATASTAREEMARVSATDVSKWTVADKRTFILSHHLALYDVIEECDILGSSDSSIRSVVPADLRPILSESKVSRIFVNGKTAGKYYEKYLEQATGIRAEVLPSTSPANAAWSLEKLTEAWREALIGY